MALNPREELVEFVPLTPLLGLLLLPSVILAWFGPNVASVVSGAKHQAPHVKTVVGEVIQEGKHRSKVELEFPSRIKISETINVRAWFQPDITAGETAFSGKLESSDFKITSTNASESASPEYKYVWDWLLSPGGPGNRALYFWVDPSTELVVHGSNVNAQLGPAKNKVMLRISVLTELGLTPTQEAWAKAIGGFVGVIGTIVAFGFWKWNRKDKEKEKVEIIAHPPTASTKDKIKEDHDKSKEDASRRERIIKPATRKK